MVVTCSSSGAKELPWVVCKLKRASLQYDYAGTLPYDALLSSPPEGLSDSTGESLSSCSAFSAWASSASIFFSIESRWFSRAAAVCSPRWSSLNAFRDIRIHSYTCVVEPTWARSASDCGPAPAPFCSFDMVEVICGVVVVVAWKTSATLKDDEAQALARSHLGTYWHVTAHRRYQPHHISHHSRSCAFPIHLQFSPHAHTSTPLIDPRQFAHHVLWVQLVLRGRQ
jgi:hypothetical protein